MGAHLARRYLWDAEVEPDPLRMPTFDPLYGFPERKERGELRPEQGREGSQKEGHPAPGPASPPRALTLCKPPAQQTLPKPHPYLPTHRTSARPSPVGLARF